MIRFYIHPTTNPLKVALFLEEAGLPYEVVPVDTRKGEQHAAAFRAINPNGKLPAIVDTDGAGGVAVRVFDSSASCFISPTRSGASPARPPIAGNCFPGRCSSAGIGPYSGQAVHFQRAAPEKLPYAVNRYRREAERHYAVLDAQLAGRSFIVCKDLTIVDMSAWGWIDRAPVVLTGSDDPLAAFPNLKRWFQAIDARPAVARARIVGSNHAFKQEVDEVAKRALFPSNYPATTA